MKQVINWVQLALSRRASWIGLVFLCIALFLPGLFQIPVTDVDEARFSQASKQMLETHDYWHINLQNTPRHLKPPAIYWLQSLSTHLTQSAPYNQIFSYRLPSFFAATLTTLCIFFLATPRFGRKTAFIASVIFASTLIVAFESSFSTTDACLMLSIFIMQWSLGEIYFAAQQQQTAARRWPFAFWTAMALGIFLKGIAPIFALGTAVALCLFERQWRWLKQLHIGLGLLGVLALTLAWLVPFSVAGHSNFLWDMISQDVAGKVTGGQEGHGQPIGYYLLLMPLLFWPMSLYFTTACQAAKQLWQRAEIRFLAAWILPNWLIYELIPTKLIHYLMPIFPAMALVIALALHTISSRAPQRRIGLSVEAIIWFGYNTLLAAGIIALPYYLIHWLPISVALAAIAVLINMVLAYRYFKQQRIVASLTSNALTAICVYSLLFYFAFPNLNLLWNSQHVAKLLQTPRLQKLVKQSPVLVAGYHEPSLVFEAGTRAVEFSDLETIEVSYQHQQPTLALMSDKYFQRFRRFAQQHHLTYRVTATINGYDINHGRHITLTLIEPSSTPVRSA